MLKKSMLLFLAAVMLVVGVWGPVPVSAAETEYADFMYYVFVVDASTIGEKGELCAAVCESIRNILPQEDVRVGVIAYGYSNDGADLYSYATVARPNCDTEFVHQIMSLEQADGASGRTLYERLLDAFSSSKKFSPHGQGLLAGVDMLCAAGVPREAGCVIWLSDGIKSSNAWETERDARIQAVELAKQNRWPVYTIHTDYGEGNETKKEEALKILQEVAGEPDAPAYQRVDVQTAAELPFRECNQALLEILPGEKWQDTMHNGVVSTEYTIENLTSGYTVAFLGDGVTEVSVEFPQSETKIYRDTEVDGDVRVVRGSCGFVVTLNNPEPATWRVNAHGTGDVLVYRDASCRVNIDLCLETELGDELVSGAEETMKLGYEENIHFVPQFLHGDGSLILDENADDTTAKLVIQSGKPKKEHEFRDLMEIGISMDRLSLATEWITTDDLGKREYELYRERTGLYRARIVLERKGETTQQMVGKWFEFGSGNLPPKELSEDPIECSVVADDVVGICLSERVKKEPIDLWKIGLVPKEGFQLVDAKGKALGSSEVETYDDVVYVQACSYVGSYELVFWTMEGGESCQVKVQMQVEPHPEYQDDDVLELELYLGPDWLRWLMNRLNGSVCDDRFYDDLGRGVESVRLIGENQEQIQCILGENMFPGMLEICPQKAGTYDLQMEIEYAAQITDENGEVHSQIDMRPVRIKVISLSKWGLIALASAVVLIVLVWLFFAWRRRFPHAMRCTLEQLDEKGETISVVLERRLFAYPEEPGQTQATGNMCLSTWERLFGISAERLFEDFENQMDIDVEDKEHDDQTGLEDMEDELNNVSGLWGKAGVKRIRLVGVYSAQYAYKIRGVRRNDKICTIKCGEKEKSERLTHSRKILKDQSLRIEVDLSKIDRSGFAEEEETSDAKWCLRIVPITDR